MYKLQTLTFAAITSVWISLQSRNMATMFTIDWQINQGIVLALQLLVHRHMLPNFGKPLIYAQQYFCNKTHLKTMGKKCKLQKKITQVFIASLVGELSHQWINPGHHRIRLFIGSTKIFVSSPYTKRFQSYRC